MKLIFAGTPVFAERHLQALIASEHELVAVYTQPDRPAGRGKKVAFSPVKQLALEHGIEVVQPKNFRDPADIEKLEAYGADLMIVVAYGILLPKAVLDAPRFGCLNVHGSILPRWRGAAPIQRAIEAGDAESGVTIMQMDEGLDTGDMLVKSHCTIGAEDTAADLHDRLAELGPPALLQAIDQIENGTSDPEPQNDQLSNYASKIVKDEALVDWREPAQTIHRKIRAFNPFPVCFTFLGEHRVRIYAARMLSDNSLGHATKNEPGALSIQDNQLVVRCGEGSLIIDKLQLPGKKVVDGASYLNGINHQLSVSAFSRS